MQITREIGSSEKGGQPAVSLNNIYRRRRGKPVGRRPKSLEADMVAHNQLVERYILYKNSYLICTIIKRETALSTCQRHRNSMWFREENQLVKCSCTGNREDFVLRSSKTKGQSYNFQIYKISNRSLPWLSFGDKLLVSCGLSRNPE